MPIGVLNLKEKRVIAVCIAGQSMTEGWRERGGAAAGASAGPRACASPRAAGRRLLPRRPIAKFNAKVMRARVRLRAARRNAGAAGGGRPARHQCLTDDRDTRRLANFPHSRCNGSPDKFRDIVHNSEIAHHFTDDSRCTEVRALDLIGVWHFQVTRVRRACRWCASRSVPRLDGIPVSIMCVSDARRPARRRVLCNASNKTSAFVSSHMYIKNKQNINIQII